ncbi:MAG: hypothetical protein PVH46_05325 [Granulosicoccaceae bacterium]|jgi:hypothetical protein
MAGPHCAFRKPVMGSGFTCPHASLCHTPMGCSVLCSDLDAYNRCNTLLELLIEAGRFVLSYTPDTDSFTHGKLMKVQHGGLVGLNKALRPVTEPSPVEDIAELVTLAESLTVRGEELPLQEVITEMRNWQTRRRRRTR